MSINPIRKKNEKTIIIFHKKLTTEYLQNEIKPHFLFIYSQHHSH